MKGQKMSDGTRYDLPSLRKAAREACQCAFAQADHLGGAVNWGDLDCREASYSEVETDDGRRHSRHAVLIEEASADATEFAEFIRQELKMRGFQEVDIILEW